MESEPSKLKSINPILHYTSTHQRGPIAALRRVIKSSNHSKPSNPQNQKPNHHQPSTSTSSPTPQTHSQPPPPPPLFHTTHSNPSSSNPLQSAPDPYARNPTLNRDIWPVLTNTYVFASDDTSLYHTHSPLTGLTTIEPSRDWTTSLGISVDPNLQTSSNSSQLSPTPARFKLHGSHQPRKHHHPPPSRRRKRTTSSLKKRKTYRSSAIYGTYTSLARQEIEQERARQLLGSSLSPSRSSSSHRVTRWGLGLLQSQTTPTHHQDLQLNQTSNSSHTRTRSSISTNRLQKTPTSSIFPAPPISSRPRHRLRKKSAHSSRLDNATSSTSNKDQSGTTHPSHTTPPSHPLNPITPSHQTSSKGKAGVRLRYQNAMNDDDILKDDLKASLLNSSRLTSDQDPDLIISPDDRTGSEPSSGSRNHSNSLEKLPQVASSRQKGKRVESNPSLQSRAFSPTSSIQPGSAFGSISPNSSALLDQHSQPHSFDEDLEDDLELSDPTHWHQRQIQLQERQDSTRHRYRHLKPTSDTLPSTKRRSLRKPTASRRSRPDHRPLEYRITEQLLIQSKWSGNLSQTSHHTPSHYHSIKSTRSVDALSEAAAKLSTSISSHRKTPQSLISRLSRSSPSLQDTSLSLVTDWSHGHRTLPPEQGSSSSSARHRHDPGLLSGLRSSESLSVQALSSSFKNPSLSLPNPEELEMGYHPHQTSGRFRSKPLHSINPIGVPKAYLKKVPSSARRLKRSASQPRARSTLHLDHARMPNDVTHHDQAGLLSPSASTFEARGDHQPSPFSPIPRSPLLIADDDSSTTASSHSWYDAADDFVPDEAVVVDEEDLRSSSHRRVSRVLRGRTPAKVTPLRRAISAAIVYDPTTSIPFQADPPISWTQRAARLFTSPPHLTPLTTVPLIELMPYPPSSLQPRLHPNDRLGFSGQTVQGPSYLPGAHRMGHKKTYSSPSFMPKLPLPLPPEPLRNHAIFNPTDDPNFLSHPPHQLKRAWKRNHARLKRALSEPTVPKHLRGTRARSKYVRSLSVSDDEDACLTRPEARTSTSPNGFDGVPNPKAGPSGWKGETSEIELMSLEGLPPHQLGSSRIITQLPYHAGSPVEDMTEQVSLSLLARTSSAKEGTGLKADDPLGFQQAQLSSSSSSSSGRSGFKGPKMLECLSLVPINAWCFVFGFVFFPLWYVGSFYPSLQASRRPLKQPASLDPIPPPPPQTRTSLSAIQTDQAPPDPEEAHEFLRPDLEEIQSRGVHLSHKRIEIRNQKGGPISGWPRRGHMAQSSIESRSTRRSQPEGGDEAHRQTSISSSEENRQPNFDQTSLDLRALGGFWSEIAPRGDIELAQASDAPMWAYQRAVHTWRLRCRVMAVIFPLLVIPCSVIAGVVVSRTSK